MTASPSRGPGRALLLLLLLVAHAAALKSGARVFIGGDDWSYARLANEVLHGTFVPAPHHHEHRFTIFVPAALLSAVLDGAIRFERLQLWPELCSLAALGLTFALATRIAGAGAGLFAGLMFLTNLLHVGQATLLVPDAVVATFVVAFLACVCMGRSATGRRAAATWGALAGLVLLTGAFAKESMVWVGPWLLLSLALDWRARAHRGFWTALVATSALLGVVVLVAYAVVLGDPLARLHALQVHNDSDWGLPHWQQAGYAQRLLLGPLRELAFGDNFGVAFLLGLPVAAATWFRAESRGGTLGSVSLLCLCLLLGLWFGSSSLTAYVPLKIEERFALPLHPPLCILAGVGLWRMVQVARDLAPMPPLRTALAASALGFCVAAAANLARERRLFLVVYAGIALASACALLWRRTGAVAASAIAALALAWPVYNLRSPGRFQPRWLAVESTAVREQLGAMAAVDPSRPVTVLTDQASTGALPLYFGYQVPANLHLRTGQPEPEPGELRVVYVNQERITWSKTPSDHGLLKLLASTTPADCVVSTPEVKLCILTSARDLSHPSGGWRPEYRAPGPLGAPPPDPSAAAAQR